MYATVRRYTANKNSVRDASRRIEKEFRPIISAIPGFVSYALLEGDEERGQDVLVTVTICETRVGVDESIMVAASWVKEHLSTLGISAPTVTTGEVLVSVQKGR
jgi:hypothetical protein